MIENRVLKMTLTGLFITLGLLLPLVTLQLPNLGNMLLPMHLPILLCGFICGGPYGLLAGAVTPLLRSVLFGMPPLMPVALAMAFELATYGLVAGVVYSYVAKNSFGRYLSLITALIAGRLVWGLAAYFIYRSIGATFTLAMFMAGAFFNAIPGLVVQLVVVPMIVQRVKVKQ